MQLFQPSFYFEGANTYEHRATWGQRESLSRIAVWLGVHRAVLRRSVGVKELSHRQTVKQVLLFKSWDE